MVRPEAIFPRETVFPVVVMSVAVNVSEFEYDPAAVPHATVSDGTELLPAVTESAMIFRYCGFVVVPPPALCVHDAVTLSPFGKVKVTVTLLEEDEECNTKHNDRETCGS